MKNCLNGHAVDESFTFCPTCGSALSISGVGNQSVAASFNAQCVFCGATLRSGVTFCENCGRGVSITSTNGLNPEVLTTHSGTGWDVPVIDGAAILKRSSPVLAILLLCAVLAQFALTGFAGLHGGSKLIKWVHAGQWTFNTRLLEFWKPFTYIDPAADLFAWRLRVEVVGLFLTLGFALMILLSKKRSTRFGSWCTLLVISAISFAISLAAVIQSLALDFGSRSIFQVSSLAMSNGGVTTPAIAWLALAGLMLGLTIAGTSRNRSKS